MLLRWSDWSGDIEIFIPGFSFLSFGIKPFG